jgi:hypothetical protein
VQAVIIARFLGSTDLVLLSPARAKQPKPRTNGPPSNSVLARGLIQRCRKLAIPVAVIAAAAIGIPRLLLHQCRARGARRYHRLAEGN